MSKGRGVGLFEAGNFHPDIILSILGGDEQHIVFIDPKGLRNIGAGEPKIEFYRTIRKLGERLGDPALYLHLSSQVLHFAIQPLRSIPKEECRSDT
jgi:hypothetical protein